MITSKGFATPLLIALIAVFLMGGGVYVYQSKKIVETPAAQTAGWETYTNTEFHYTFTHPKSVEVWPSAEEERLPVAESGWIETRSALINVKGATSLVTDEDVFISVSVVLNSPHDLKTFAESEYQKQVGDKNPNFPQRHVGSLDEILFAEHIAYTTTITNYPDGHGSDTFRLIYVNNGGTNFVIQYPLIGTIAKQIVDTFKFNS
ncbi:MAG: hypothetical protein AAB442_02275 [Patescibacteria group bacterium]